MIEAIAMLTALFLAGVVLRIIITGNRQKYGRCSVLSKDGGLDEQNVLDVQ